MPRFFCRPAFLRALLVAALAALAAPLAGCHDFGDVTGSIPGSTATPTNDAKLRAYAEEAGKRYERNPGEKTASIEYARALRAQTRYSEAVAVIQTAAIKAPKDFDVLGEYGKALADSGQLPQAKEVLSPRLYARCAALGRHVGAGKRRRQAWRSRERHAILSRRAQDRAGRAKRAHQYGAFARAGQAVAGGRGGAETGRGKSQSRRAHARKSRSRARSGREIQRGGDGRVKQTFRPTRRAPMSRRSAK